MRRFARMLLAAAMAGWLLLLSGCAATAQVAVDARPDGTGVVTVRVTLDKAAVAAVGDVATELQTGDLAASGWSLVGPTSQPGGSVAVSATKPFATLAQASQIVEEIAGSGPAGTRPFQVAISRHRSFWKTTTVLKGDVDLRCALACFGDPGLQKIIGSATGIDPATVQRDTGINPATVFHFEMSVNLPGKLKSTNASKTAGSKAVTQLAWTPKLGADVPLVAMTQTNDTAHVRDVTIGAIAGGLVLLGLLTWLVLGWRRRRRRRASAFTSTS